MKNTILTDFLTQNLILNQMKMNNINMSMAMKYYFEKKNFRRIEIISSPSRNLHDNIIFENDLIESNINVLVNQNLSHKCSLDFNNHLDAHHC